MFKPTIASNNCVYCPKIHEDMTATDSFRTIFPYPNPGKDRQYHWGLRPDLLAVTDFSLEGEDRFAPCVFGYDFTASVSHAFVRDLVQLRQDIYLNIGISEAGNPFIGTRHERLPFVIANLALILGHKVIFDGNPRAYSDSVDEEHGRFLCHFNNFCNMLTPDLAIRAAYWDYRTADGKPVARCIDGMARRVWEFLPNFSEFYADELNAARNSDAPGACPFVLHPWDHLPVWDLSHKAVAAEGLLSVFEWHNVRSRRIRPGAQPVYMHRRLDDPAVFDLYTEADTVPAEDALGGGAAAMAAGSLHRDDAVTIQKGLPCIYLGCQAGDARCSACPDFGGPAGKTSSLIYCKRRV